MPYDRFLIAPFNSGLVKDTKPWLIMDDAFVNLTNAYVFRGRVRKRFGTRLIGTLGQQSSRLKINLGMTNGSGNISVTVPGAVFAVGQVFTIGSSYYTVVTNGSPANLLRSDGVVATATYNTTTGALVIDGALANTSVYFYPSTPVMGFALYEVTPINNNPTLAFDTQFAYQLTTNGWMRAGTMVWTGSDSQFFWSQNYRAPLASNTLLFTTNNNPPDLMSYWNGTTWTSFSPQYNSSSASLIIQTCLLIFSFKGRLLLFNTTETYQSGMTFPSATFVNRARWSLIGDATASNAFFDDPFLGLGGFLDAPTQEAIISGEIIKDRLIIFFEQSTWEFVFTNNQADPFRWQKINDELGCESTFSVVPFDKAILAVGNVGIHACNGANVERIDEKIPDEVFDIKNAFEGVTRVFGVRDYKTELVYWTFPSLDTNVTNYNPTYPTRVLVYNYRNGSWAFNNDSFTAFGYFQQQQSQTWETVTQTWEEATWTWNSGVLQQQNLEILAGNQQGFTLIIDSEVQRNAPSLYIYSLTLFSSPVGLQVLCINNNLEVTTGDLNPDDFVAPGDCVIIENVIGMTNVNGRIFAVTVAAEDNVFLSIIDDPDNLRPISGTYLGGGTLARVSNINLESKPLNPYAKDGKSAFINKVDFNVSKTTSGQVTVDYYPSFTNLSGLQEAEDNDCLQGTGVLETSPYTLYPLEQYQTQLWHPVYIQIDGETVQLALYMELEQIAFPDIAFSNFELHGMVLYAKPIGRLE